MVANIFDIDGQPHFEAIEPQVVASATKTQETNVANTILVVPTSGKLF